MRTQISGISEKQRINLDILSFFSKRNIFYTSKQHFFLFQFAVLKECNSFCATESDIDLRTILHPSMNYWFQYCDLH